MSVCPPVGIETPRPTTSYYVVKWLLGRVVDIFFREIEVVGKENVPAEGPVIFVGNHPNQFVVRSSTRHRNFL